VSWLRDLAGVYARVFRRGFELAVRHWWLALVAIAYQGALVAGAFLLGSLGLVGRFLLTFAGAALMSSWLVLVGTVIRDGRATPADVRGSFIVHLGDIVTFGFLFWALQMIAAIAFADFAYAAIVFELALLVFLSAVPEQMYLKHETGAALFVESYRFVAANWVEWLPATGILVIVVGGLGLVPFLPLSLALAGFGLALAFLVRGLLFLELTTSSRRARDFQRRAAR
jgi:hypothetical protein